MKKRAKRPAALLAAALAGAMLLGLASCGSGGKDELTVGVVYIASAQDTSGYTYAHHKGILEMQAALGLKDSQLVVRDNVDDRDAAATQAALQELVDAGCDIIFATSYYYMGSVEKLAKLYPDVIFSHCSGSRNNGTNFNNYFGRIYQARYLAGVAAGLKLLEAEKPLAGYVAAMDSRNSEVTGGVNAWALGIQSVYPEAEVKVKVTGSWDDPEKEAAAAQALIDAGCYVIGQHCDTDGPQRKAQENGVFGCGYNSDMTESAPDAHLCAPVWNWGAYYTAAVQAVMDGTWTPENYFAGMAEGLVGLSDLNERAIAPGTAEAIAKAKAGMADGSLVVFGAGLTKADGTVIGHALSDDEIRRKIDYYIQGVELL